MFNPNDLASGLGGITSGLFGDSGQPYEDYENELKKYYEEAQNWQSPYYNAGKNAIPQYQDWLNGQKDPAQFINGLMGKYQESPWAQYQQDQSIRAGQNAGSANGLAGSSALAKFLQENAAGISSKDMQNWLARVLGINTQYGEGVGNLMHGGQQSANALSGLASNLGQNFAEASMGKTARENQDRNNLWGGIFQTGASLAPLFL